MSEKRLNILEGIEKGISQSYLGGFTKIVNLDIDSVPGVVFPNGTLQKAFPFNSGNIYSGFVFTADADNDTLTGTVQNLHNAYEFGQSVRLTTSGTLPAGLAAATTYYVGWSGSTGPIKLATTFKNLEDGVYVNITDTGTGTHTITAEKMGAVYEIYPLRVTGSYYNRVLLDDSNQVWVSRAGSGWMKLTGMGSGAIRSIAVWKNYILVFHNQAVDAFGPVNGLWSTGTWENSFATLESDSTSHPSIVMSNDILYIGGSNYVASLQEVSGQTFAPGDTDTFAFDAKALDLPAGEKIYALDELNSQLAIGTGNGKNGHLYFWDTFSPSFESIVKTSIPYVATMKVVNNILYFFDNNWGTIYASNGVSTQKIKDFPESSFGIQQVAQENPLSIFSRPHALMVVKDKIFFGVGAISAGGVSGIYSYNLLNGSLTLENTCASQNLTSAVSFYALYYISPLQFLAGVYDSSLSADYRNRLESTFVGNYYRSTNSFLETGLMTVGTKYQPTTFRFFEIQLGKEMSTGQTITLYYRTNLTDSWTTIGTMSYTNDGAIASKIIENSSVRGDQIQFKTLITCGNTATTGPELKAIYIY